MPDFAPPDQGPGPAVAARGGTAPSRSAADLEAQALRAEVEELLRAGRLKDEALTLAAHELSTPLTAIKAYLQALTAHYGEPDFTQGQEFLGVLDRETSRLIRIVERALESARSAATELEVRRRRLCLDEVVGQVAVTLRPLLEERSMTLVLALPEGLPELQADPDLLAQVLVNLVHNAVKFSPRGSRVMLRASVTAEGVVVEVRDEGCGIAPQEIGRVFEPYYRSPGARATRAGGAGLGLAIVKTIVERHGGRVWVESEPGRGAVFRFSLPWG